MIKKSLILMSCIGWSLFAQAEQPMLLFVSGSLSHCGKSSISLGILDGLLETAHFKASEIAYIKPVTQATGRTPVQKFCKAHEIDFQVESPFIFKAGLTREIIQGESKFSPEDSLRAIKSAVDKISEGKKVVVIDGVGFPGVGSVAGISNARVAAFLGSPVLYVGVGGIGLAIDDVENNTALFKVEKASVLGGIFNLVENRELEKGGAFHDSLERDSTLVKQYFATRKPHFHVYGHIPVVKDMTPSKACPVGKSLDMKEEDAKFVAAFNKEFKERVNFELLLSDLKNFYSAKDSSSEK